tara:strand:- start:594 stop:827 length:234 start_codon:yes stop_codon:yes gene_type:complete
MIQVPIIVLLVIGMCIMGIMAFTYEYGKQVRELKELKRKVRERDIELTYERFRNKIGETSGREKLNPAIFEKISKKK